MPHLSYIRSPHYLGSIFIFILFHWPPYYYNANTTHDVNLCQHMILYISYILTFNFLSTNLQKCIFTKFIFPPGSLLKNIYPTFNILPAPSLSFPSELTCLFLEILNNSKPITLLYSKITYHRRNTSPGEVPYQGLSSG